MMQLSDIAGRAQRALRPMTQALTYREITTYTVKAASTAAVGATVVNLNNLPAGFDRVLVGDQIAAGSQYRAVAADTLAVAGVIAAPITVALATQITSGASITVNRTTDSGCRGFTERLDTSTTIAPGVATKDARVTILADSLSVEPKANQTVIAEGVTRAIKNVGRDPAGAAWVLLASG